MGTKTVAKKATTKKGTTKTAQKSTKGLAVTMKTAKKSKKTMEVPAFFPKYPEYRLSDVLSCKWSRHMNVGKVKRLEEYVSHEKETLKEYILRLFPNSIASRYLSKTNRLNDTRVLSTVVDQFVSSHKIPIPADDVMVMHLRVGDVIDRTSLPVDEFLNRRVNSVKAMYGHDAEGWSPFYVRCLASFDRVLEKTKGLGFHKISFVYGFHVIMSIEKSKEYLAALVQYAESKGFEVEMVTHTDADVSFAYACNAKHFIPGGGGFSKLMSEVVKAKGNHVYHIPI